MKIKDKHGTMYAAGDLQGFLCLCAIGPNRNYVSLCIDYGVAKDIANAILDAAQHEELNRSRKERDTKLHATFGIWADDVRTLLGKGWHWDGEHSFITTGDADITFGGDKAHVCIRSHPESGFDFVFSRDCLFGELLADLAELEFAAAGARKELERYEQYRAGL